MSEGFSDEDVDLVATALMRAMLGDDLPAADQSGPGWTLARSEAHAVLTALAAAGRLLPEGAKLSSEIRVRWFVRSGRHYDWGTEGMAHASEMAKKPPPGAVRGEIVQQDTYTTPWSVVEPVAIQEAAK